MPLGVCEALESAVDHQEIVIRGVMTGESHHGFFLSQGINGDPCPGWRLTFLTAPSALALGLASSFGVQLTAEQRRLNLDFFGRLSKMSKGRPLSGYRVVARGVFVRRAWSLIFRRADGTYYSLGSDLDPFGVYQALLVMKSAREE